MLGRNAHLDDVLDAEEDLLTHPPIVIWPADDDEED